MSSGKVSVKTILLVVIALLVVVLGVVGMSTARQYLSSAAGGAEPAGVRVDATETTAKVTWNTEKATLARVQYGTTPASMLLQSDLSEETEAKNAHSITLSGLKAATTYYYRIKVGDDLYDNGGIPFSFKTKGAGGASEASGSAKKVEAVATLVPTQAQVQVGASAASCTPGVDYNKDGATNGLDIVYCNQNNGSPSSSGGGAVPTSAVATPTPTPVAKVCTPGVDYNKDGATNGLDIVYCNTTK